jgi:pilus assembly protein CpaE
MEIWIVSDNDQLTACVRKVLQRLEVECPLTHIVSAASLGDVAASWSQSSPIVFFTARELAADHFEQLRDIRMQTDGELVVVSSVPNHAAVLKAIRAGATDYLNADGNLDDEIESFVSRITSERSRRSAKGRLITIVPCHAPSDASFLSVNMAAAVAKRCGSCGLLDFQLRGGELALLLQLVPRHTVFDLLQQRQSVDETMFQQALTAHESGIHLLAGPPLFSDLRNIEPHTCQHILSLAQWSHPYVIVNSEDVLHAEQVKALATSDEIVLTMRLDVVSLHRAQQHVEFMTRNHVSASHLHVVAMETGLSGELPIKVVKEILKVPQIHCIPHDPVACTMSINIGNPLVLESPKSKAAQAIVGFSDVLTGMSDMDRHADNRPFSVAKAATLLAINTLHLCK